MFSIHLLTLYFLLITYSVTERDEVTIKHVYTSDHLDGLVMQMIEIYSNEVNNENDNEIE
jgi:hypothetical protein